MIGCDCADVSVHRSARLPPPAVHLRRAARRAGVLVDAGSRPADAGAAPSHLAASTRSCSPTATPTTSSASTTSGGSTRSSSGRWRATATSATLDDIRAHVRLRLRSGDAEGGGLPQLELFRIDGSVLARPTRRSSPIPLMHGAATDSWFPIRRLRLSDRLQSPSPTRRGRCSTASTCSCSTRCASGRIRRTSRSTRRSTAARAHRRRAHVFHAHVPRSQARADLRRLPRHGARL